MTLVLTGLVPHSPLLVPNIGKEHRTQLAKTLKAYDILAKDLVESQPENLVIISSHAASGSAWWNANVCLKYQTDLSLFGDLLTKAEWFGALDLAEALQDFLGQEHQLRLYSQTQLDYGTAVPLLLLGEAVKQVRILPIGYIDNQPKRQIEFGRRLGEFLRQQPSKTALIGSGDLAHCLGSDQPSGLQARGHKFDQRLQEALRQNNSQALLDLSVDTANETGQCAWLSYLTLQAAMDGQNGCWQNLVYEAPFGVGSAIWRWQAVN